MEKRLFKIYILPKDEDGSVLNHGCHEIPSDQCNCTLREDLVVYL